MDEQLKFPFYAKASLIIMGTCAFIAILYIGQDIIVPLIYATIFAILLNPVVNFFTARGLNRIIAIILTLLLAILFTFGLFYFISSQVSRFTEDLPQLKEKFNTMVDQGVKFISVTLNISTKQVTQWIATTKSSAINNTGAVVGQTLTTVSGALIIAVLLPVYVFMILLYKSLFLEFIRKLFDRSLHKTVVEVLTETKGLIHNYLVGLLIEAGIVATLNSIALMILGIKYAILLGIIGALLNIIPYIGGIIAVSLPMTMALITKPPSYALLVLGSYMIIQLIDNNFLVPKIVASKVKINAIVSIVVVFIGNDLWGIPGMFLSIPLTAIIKVIFDHIEPLKPWGFLLGDHMPSPTRQIFKFPSRKSKAINPAETQETKN
ncbi:MAG: AI-2E family transporter [Chitinophagales bacterium]|nr:AI-2E family transporter [Chitinophagales bacterium]